MAAGSGREILFTVPERKTDYYWVAASARDSKGLRSLDYLTLKNQLPEGVTPVEIRPNP